jgi:hypothetical protein
MARIDIYQPAEMPWNSNAQAPGEEGSSTAKLYRGRSRNFDCDKFLDMLDPS